MIALFGARFLGKFRPSHHRKQIEIVGILTCRIESWTVFKTRFWLFEFAIYLYPRHFSAHLYRTYQNIRWTDVNNRTIHFMWILNHTFFACHAQSADNLYYFFGFDPWSVVLNICISCVTSVLIISPSTHRDFMPFVFLFGQNYSFS